MRQVCPICRTEVRVVEKFPYYLCSSCLEKVTDRHGNQVIYQFNSSPFGFKARYKNNPEQEYVYDICYIRDEELKVYSDGKNSCYIQPVNFLKFASRPEGGSASELSRTIPFDPEKRKARKKQITVEKIIVPAFIISLLACIPLIGGVVVLTTFSNASGYFNLLFYGVPSILALAYCWRIIQSRIKKFSRASYFKQHSWAFFGIGIASFFATVLMLIFNVRI